MNHSKEPFLEHSFEQIHSFERFFEHSKEWIYSKKHSFEWVYSFECFFEHFFEHSSSPATFMPNLAKVLVCLESSSSSEASRGKAKMEK